MKFKIDSIRGIAYKGGNGYVIQNNSKGLFINREGQEIILNNKNTKILKDSEVYGKGK